MLVRRRSAAVQRGRWAVLLQCSCQSIISILAVPSTSEQSSLTYAKGEQGLTAEEIRGELLRPLEGRELRRVLIIPPDFTRFHSNAGFITNVYYHALQERGCVVDILPALGTHEPVSREQAAANRDYRVRRSSETN